MKIKTEKLFYWSIIFQVLTTQGVLFFIIFKFLGDWELKKVLHPLSFFLVLIIFALKTVKKIKVTLTDIVFFSFFLCLFFLMLFNVDSIKSGYIVFREVYFLFILIFIFNQVEIKTQYWRVVLKLLLILLFLNSIFIFITHYLGPVKYMVMITDRYNWGIDPDYKFKITNFHNFWRSPALIGDAASVGYFSVISYLLMDQDEHFKKIKYLALVPLFFSFIRSAYLVFIVYEFLKFFTKKKNLKKLILIIKVTLPIIIAFVVLSPKVNVLSSTSLYYRFYYWANEINVDFNLLYGGAIGNIGGGARGQGFIATIDSYWLFLLLSSGIVGIIFVIIYIYEKSLKTNKSNFILISFFISGFFVSLTQSLVFLCLFPLFFIKIKKENINL